MNEYRIQRPNMVTCPRYMVLIVLAMSVVGEEGEEGGRGGRGRGRGGMRLAAFSKSSIKALL